MDRTHALRTVKKRFCQFQNGNFCLNDKIRSIRSSAIDNDLFSDLVNSSLRISSEKIAERLNVDSTNAFLYLKQRGNTSNRDASEIGYILLQ